MCIRDRINLGDDGFVNGNATFSATLSWNESLRQITVTVTSDSSSSKKVNSPTTAIFTPDAAMMGTSGRPVAGAVSATAQHF